MFCTYRFNLTKKSYGLIILDNIDVGEITNEHLANVSVADVLAVSNVKIFQNNNLLYFLVMFPKPKLLCCNNEIFDLPLI